MLKKQQVVDFINWEATMSAPRYAGGHEEVMDVLFQGNARVIAKYIEEDYQGTEAYAYEFPCGTVAIVTDYFGSCSGCDSWEDANDEQAKNLIQQLAINSRIFPDRKAAKKFCISKKPASDYPLEAAKHLVDQL